MGVQVRNWRQKQRVFLTQRFPVNPGEGFANGTSAAKSTNTKRSWCVLAPQFSGSTTRFEKIATSRSEPTQHQAPTPTASRQGRCYSADSNSGVTFVALISASANSNGNDLQHQSVWIELANRNGDLMRTRSIQRVGFSCLWAMTSDSSSSSF